MKETGLEHVPGHEAHTPVWGASGKVMWSDRGSMLMLGETVTDQSASPRTQAAGTPALSAGPLTGTGLGFQTSTCTTLPASKVLVLTQVRWGLRLRIPLRRCWYSRLFQDEAARRGQSVQRPNHLPSGGMRNGTPALHRKLDHMTSKSPPGVRDKDAKVQPSGPEKRGSRPSIRSLR